MLLKIIIFFVPPVTLQKNLKALPHRNKQKCRKSANYGFRKKSVYKFNKYIIFLLYKKFRLFLSIISAVGQVVSLWLPTAVARIRVRAACGVCGGQSGTGAGFLRVLRFSLPIIPPISPSS
jgi:hypothetical protein